ncbi:MAG: type III-B CRISPR module RAMP protein Cmr6 [Candidatus Dechloromonas phosphoritropha]
MTIATPNYLHTQISDAAPGHRFSLYYAGWDENFSKLSTGAAQTLKTTICPLPQHSRQLLESIEARQAALAAGNLNIFSYPAIASAPFATGLGNEHPLENGFSFLSPYGLPYLPGSGVKGVIRKAAEELASGEWGESEGWSEEIIRALFGPPGEDDETRDSNPRQGALRFWDVFPAPEQSAKNDKPLLTVEIMTPHLGKYYQGDATPNTSLTPTPISFLAVATKARFAFYVECNPAFLTPAQQKNWQTLIQSAFEHAGKWLGFGAKTAVGYGRMTLDERAQEAAEKLATEKAEKQQKEDQAAQKQAELEQLSPFDRSVQEVLDAKPKDQSELKALFNALKGKRWAGEEARNVAERLQAMMKASNQWREKSEKKRPEKDEPYQMTLTVKSFLEIS